MGWTVALRAPACAGGVMSRRMKLTVLVCLLFALASTNAKAIDFTCSDEYGFKEDLSNSIQVLEHVNNFYEIYLPKAYEGEDLALVQSIFSDEQGYFQLSFSGKGCLLYTSPSPRDQRGSRMPSSA